MTDIRTAAATDIGHHRTTNEDDCFAGEDLWVVADGMGGHENGELAAAMATLTVATHLELIGRRDATALTEAIRLAHRMVVGIDDAGAGMGTTIVCAARDGDSVNIAWVGDSRAYLLRPDGTLRQLTHDHNQAGELVRTGQLSVEAARKHPGQSRLTRCLGNAASEDPQVSHVSVLAHGRLLLCTDGLSGELTDRRIRRLMITGDPDAVVERLLDAALAAGGRDNITAVVVDLTSPAGPVTPWDEHAAALFGQGQGVRAITQALRTEGHDVDRRAVRAALEARGLIAPLCSPQRRPGRSRPRRRAARLCPACSAPIDALAHCRCG